MTTTNIQTADSPAISLGDSLFPFVFPEIAVGPVVGLNEGYSVGCCTGDKVGVSDGNCVG